MPADTFTRMSLSGNESSSVNLSRELRYQLSLFPFWGGCRQVEPVVDLVKMSQCGMRIYLNNGIDLFSVLPEDQGQFEPNFAKYVLGIGDEAVRQK